MPNGEVEINLVPNKKYYYKFVIDGDWVLDPSLAKISKEEDSTIIQPPAPILTPPESPEYNLDLENDKHVEEEEQKVINNIEQYNDNEKPTMSDDEEENHDSNVLIENTTTNDDEIATTKELFEEIKELEEKDTKENVNDDNNIEQYNDHEKSTMSDGEKENHDSNVVIENTNTKIDDEITTTKELVEEINKANEDIKELEEKDTKENVNDDNKIEITSFSSVDNDLVHDNDFETLKFSVCADCKCGSDENEDEHHNEEEYTIDKDHLLFSGEIINDFDSGEIKNNEEFSNMELDDEEEKLEATETIVDTITTTSDDIKESSLSSPIIDDKDFDNSNTNMWSEEITSLSFATETMTTTTTTTTTIVENVEGDDDVAPTVTITTTATSDAEFVAEEKERGKDDDETIVVESVLTSLEEEQKEEEELVVNNDSTIDDNSKAIILDEEKILDTIDDCLSKEEAIILDDEEEILNTTDNCLSKEEAAIILDGEEISNTIDDYLSKEEEAAIDEAIVNSSEYNTRDHFVIR
ncbi:926_t:CDS:2 [Entrophospora sp. SA101]|nr:7890_t:CDS:2 [Entrophospora sp. SA101]CAJ0834472.1 926_t:CDS:2 [Entrophospora sp. SA101]